VWGTLGRQYRDSAERKTVSRAHDVQAACRFVDALEMGAVILGASQHVRLSVRGRDCVRLPPL